jgi:catechol 2,3-dioxygenase-like lactoylglutathione lyase family enzyme
MSLLHGPIFQVAWIIEDIAASERRFTDTLGISAWTRFDDVHFSAESWTYRGHPADFTIHVSLGYAGRQQVELIQPVLGDNLYTEHLRRRGPGLHHVAYLADDLEATVRAGTEQGMAVLQRGSLAGCDYVYLDGGGDGGWCIELMRLSDGMRQFFDSLIPEGPAQ